MICQFARLSVVSVVEVIYLIFFVWSIDFYSFRFLLWLQRIKRMAKKNISARLPGLVSSNTVRRVTRSTLKLEVHESSTSRMSMSNKSGHKKKVKFENLSTVEGNSYKNVSLEST